MTFCFYIYFHLECDFFVFWGNEKIKGECDGSENQSWESEFWVESWDWAPAGTLFRVSCLTSVSFGFRPGEDAVQIPQDVCLWSEVGFPLWCSRFINATQNRKKRHFRKPHHSHSPLFLFPYVFCTMYMYSITFTVFYLIRILRYLDIYIFKPKK